MIIEKSYDVPFALADVFQAWGSSDTVIAPATSMDVLPTKGGHYRLFMDTPSRVFKNEGVFLIVVPNRQLRYTWEWNRDGQVTEIDVIFEKSTGGCQITLTHGIFQDKESFDMHVTGWDSYIDGFCAHLAAQAAT